MEGSSPGGGHMDSVLEWPDVAVFGHKRPVQEAGALWVAAQGPAGHTHLPGFHGVPCLCSSDEASMVIGEWLHRGQFGGPGHRARAYRGCVMEDPEAPPGRCQQARDSCRSATPRGV
eukprot:10319479-Lingulodinium_polyedra.AAC.1